MRTCVYAIRLVGGILLALSTGIAAVTERAVAQSESAVARDARVGGDLERTRFVADLSDTVDFRAFLLTDPYRVIVDLPQVQFQMPPGVGEKGRGLIHAFRYGLFAKGKSRIVIDTVGPVLIDKAFVRPAENGQPARMVIDLIKATESEFTEQRLRQATLRAVKPEADSASSQGIDGSSTSGDSEKPVIVLDPGHGGPDPGTVTSASVYEKDVVFTVCKELKAALEATGRFRVLMTRDEDIFVPLEGRVEFARLAQANLMISFHADALDIKHPLVTEKMIKEVRGASVYTLSEEASDALAKVIAARENNSDALAGVELPASVDDSLASILIDLMHRETKNLSIAFAQELLKGLEGEVLLTKSPHRYADFKVLKAEDVPSVLLELGYLSNPEDETALTSAEWRSKVVKAITESIGAFFERRLVSVPG